MLPFFRDTLYIQEYFDYTALYISINLILVLGFPLYVSTDTFTNTSSNTKPVKVEIHFPIPMHCRQVPIGDNSRRLIVDSNFEPSWAPGWSLIFSFLFAHEGY